MSELDDDRDEEWFKEVYGTEYTGPPRGVGGTKRGAEPTPSKVTIKRAPNLSDSEEDDEPQDPNAVPKDFTSREAKVWEAKAKAVERNWKRRKEEELTCRLCGDVGHFAQGCPTTLGGNRKAGEVVERIPLRDKRLKPRLIGTGGAIVQGIEKEAGCRLKLEDNLSIGNGAFFVKIIGPDRVAVNKAMACVNKLVDQVQDEWKQQAGSRKSQGKDREKGEKTGAYRGGNAAINPIISAQMELISVQRLPHENNTLGVPNRRGDMTTPPLDEEKRTIEHIASQLEARRQWKVVSGSSQQSLNGSYKEGRSASGVRSLPLAHQLEKVNGGSAYYPDTTMSYLSQAEHKLEMELEYDVQNLDELERRFLEETIELTKDQNKEEDKENACHHQRLREIQEQFQHKMTKLRAKQAKNREDFLRAEAQMRHQMSPTVPNYLHYQYGGSGGSLPPPPSAGPTSNYIDPLPSSAVSAYVDPLPQYEGSYEGSYDKDFDKGYDQNPAESGLQSIRSTVYDSYPEASYSPGPASYNQKQGTYENPWYDNSGYDKAGFDSSNAYNTKCQVYDTKPYSYGTTSQYPSYG